MTTKSNAELVAEARQVNADIRAGDPLQALADVEQLVEDGAAAEAERGVQPAEIIDEAARLDAEAGLDAV